MSRVWGPPQGEILGHVAMNAGENSWDALRLAMNAGENSWDASRIAMNAGEKSWDSLRIAMNVGEKSWDASRVAMNAGEESWDAMRIAINAISAYLCGQWYDCTGENIIIAVAIAVIVRTTGMTVVVRMLSLSLSSPSLWLPPSSSSLPCTDPTLPACPGYLSGFLSRWNLPKDFKQSDCLSENHFMYKMNKPWWSEKGWSFSQIIPFSPRLQLSSVLLSVVTGLYKEES